MILWRLLLIFLCSEWLRTTWQHVHSREPCQADSERMASPEAIRSSPSAVDLQGAWRSAGYLRACLSARRSFSLIIAVCFQLYIHQSLRLREHTKRPLCMLFNCWVNFSFSAPWNGLKCLDVSIHRRDFAFVFSFLCGMLWIEMNF